MRDNASFAVRALGVLVLGGVVLQGCVARDQVEEQRAASSMDAYLKLEGVKEGGSKSTPLPPGFVSSLAIEKDGTATAVLVTRCLETGLCEVVIAQAIRTPDVKSAELNAGDYRFLLNGSWILQFNAGVSDVAGERCDPCRINVPLVIRAANDGSLVARLVDLSRVTGFLKDYETWESNRKVFLDPESWLDPEARDGSSGESAGPWFKLVPDSQAICAIPPDCSNPEQIASPAEGTVQSTWTCVPICSLCDPLIKTCGLVSAR